MRRAASGCAVRGARHDDRAVQVQRLVLKLGVRGAARDRRERAVDLAPPHHRHQRFVQTVLDEHAHCGVGAAQAQQRHRQQSGGLRGPAADAQAHELAAFEARDGRPRAVELLIDAARMRQQYVGMRRGVDAEAMALQQRDAEIRFERLDAGAQRRLRQPKLHRGAGQAALGDDAAQVAQASQIERVGHSCSLWEDHLLLIPAAPRPA